MNRNIHIYSYIPPPPHTQYTHKIIEKKSQILTNFNIIPYIYMLYT